MQLFLGQPRRRCVPGHSLYRGISAPGKKSGMSATSSKRVITFLPPPLASTSDNTPVYQQKQETQERPKSQNPYPSPIRSTLSSLIPVCTDVTNREHRASDETVFSSPYRPLSPPTSDYLTLVEPPSEGNPRVSIDVDGVASRYHATRMDIRQVFLFFCITASPDSLHASSGSCFLHKLAIC